MKIRHLFFLLLLSGIFCCPLSAQNLKSPLKTFKSLVKAIQKRDIDTYRNCWAENRVEKEGMISTLEEKPEEWDELQGIFRGKLTLTGQGTETRNGKTFYKGRVKSPDADQGGIGNLTMVKEGKKWKMYSW
jgi:hypothetical protein